MLSPEGFVAFFVEVHCIGRTDIWEWCWRPSSYFHYNNNIDEKCTEFFGDCDGRVENVSSWNVSTCTRWFQMHDINILEVVSIASCSLFDCLHVSLVRWGVTLAPYADARPILPCRIPRTARQARMRSIHEPLVLKIDLPVSQSVSQWVSQSRCFPHEFNRIQQRKSRKKINVWGVLCYVDLLRVRQCKCMCRGEIDALEILDQQAVAVNNLRSRVGLPTSSSIWYEVRENERYSDERWGWEWVSEWRKARVIYYVWELVRERNIVFIRSAVDRVWIFLDRCHDRLSRSDVRHMLFRFFFFEPWEPRWWFFRELIVFRRHDTTWGGWTDKRTLTVPTEQLCQTDKQKQPKLDEHRFQSKKRFDMCFLSCSLALAPVLHSKSSAAQRTAYRRMTTADHHNKTNRRRNCCSATTTSLKWIEAAQRLLATKLRW